MLSISNTSFITLLTPTFDLPLPPQLPGRIDEPYRTTHSEDAGNNVGRKEQIDEG